jgi:hypothetical protein
MKDVIEKEEWPSEVQEEKIWKEREIWKVWSSDDPHTEEISDEKICDGGGGGG